MKGRLCCTYVNACMFGLVIILEGTVILLFRELYHVCTLETETVYDLLCLKRFILTILFTKTPSSIHYKNAYMDFR